MTHGPVAKKKRSQEDDGEESVDAVPIPPDGGWGWMVAFASFAIHIVTDGITYSFGLFHEELVKYFDEGNGYTALIVSLLVGVTLCSGPISSSFVNKYGCRAVTIAGAIMAGVFLVISAFAQNVLTLIFTVGIGTGFGFGLIYLPAIVSVTTYFEKKRSLATGIAVCGSGLGTFIFSPVSEYLIKEFGWRGATLILAGIVFNCVIFGAMFRPLEAPKKSRKRMHYTEGNDHLEDISEKGEVIPLKVHVSGEDDDEEEPSEEKQKSNSHNDIVQNNNNNNAVAKSDNKRRSDNFLSVEKYTNANHNGLPIPRSVSIGQDMTANCNRRGGHQPHCPSNGNGVEGDRKLRPTWSQPLLLSHGQNNEGPNLAGVRKNKLSESGTMYRPDVFYQGSLMNIPRYRSRGELSISKEERHTWQKVAMDGDEKTVMCGCFPCSQETKDTFNEIMDFSIFRDWVFIIFVLSNFLTSIGFNVPYVYLVALGKSLNVANPSYLLSAIGAANTVGRIVLGYFSDKTYVNRLLVYNVCLTLCGVSTILSVFCLDFDSLMGYSIVFGFTIGAYVGLTSVILVDLLGLEKLTNAFGLLLLFQGIASLLGPPLAGVLFDMTQTYVPAFLMAGIMITLSGLVLFAIPPLQRRNLRKQKQIHFDINSDVALST